VAHGQKLERRKRFGNTEDIRGGTYFIYEIGAAFFINKLEGRAESKTGIPTLSGRLQRGQNQQLSGGKRNKDRYRAGQMV